MAWHLVWPTGARSRLDRAELFVLRAVLRWLSPKLPKLPWSCPRKGFRNPLFTTEFLDMLTKRV